MLPTEERFLRLTSNQKALLFYGYLETPTDEVMYDLYQKEISEQKLINTETEKQFTAIGYSQEQIDRMKENAKAAGLM